MALYLQASCSMAGTAVITAKLGSAMDYLPPSQCGICLTCVCCVWHTFCRDHNETLALQQEQRQDMSCKAIVCRPHKLMLVAHRERSDHSRRSAHAEVFALEQQNVSPKKMCHWQAEATHRYLCSLSKARRMRLATEVMIGVFQEGSLAASASSGTGQSILFSWISFTSVELQAETECDH